MASRAPRGPGRSSPRGSRPSGQRGTRPTARPGTTARKPAKVGTAPQLTTRAVVLLSVVLLLIASYTSTFHAWWEQRGEIQSTKAEIVMRKQAIVGLEDQKARWDDPAYVKQQARARFGWVMPGEVGYRVIGSDGVVQGDVPTLDAPAQATTTEWYDKLWGSVKESGRTPSTKKPVAPPPDKVLKNK